VSQAKERKVISGIVDVLENGEGGIS